MWSGLPCCCVAVCISRVCKCNCAWSSTQCTPSRPSPARTHPTTLTHAPTHLVPGLPCPPAPGPLQSIPDIGDYTIKKQKRFERFAPAPDSLLARAAAENTAAGSAKSIDVNGLASVIGGATPMGGATSTVSDLTAIGEG